MATIMRGISFKKRLGLLFTFIKIKCFVQVKHTGDLCIPVWLQRSAHYTNITEVGV